MTARPAPPPTPRPRRPTGSRPWSARRCRRWPPTRSRPLPNRLADPAYTVLYCHPGSALSGIEDVPGGAGCTLESCTYRDRLDEFAALGARVVGVSTQRPDEQAEFARRNRIQFPLVSDADLGLATALRLPTFRLHGTPRLKRLTLVVDRRRVVRGTLFPIRDVTGSVEDALSLVRAAAAEDSGERQEHHVQPDVPVRR